MADSIQITLPDGSTKAAPAGIRVGDFVKESIGPGLAKAAVFARFNGKEIDLTRPLTEDAKLEIFTSKTPEALDTIRHDAAHVVADAVQQLFPGTQVTIGPTIEDGFYYDFYRDKPFTPEELQAIEEEANKEIAKNLPFVREEVNVADAIQLFQSKGEKFKVEIIEDIVAKGAKTLTLYRHGDWVDFCLGPHGPSTGKIGVIKLLSTGGAYWRGDHRNPMLQRIYGTAFFDKKALEAWLKQQEEAEEARPPQARPRARPVRVLPRGARAPPSGARRAPSSTRCSPTGCAAGPGRTATRRSRRRSSTTRRSGRRAGTGASTARTCSWCSTTRPASTTSA